MMTKKNYSWLNLSYLNKSYKGLSFLHPKNLKDLYLVHKQRKDRAFKGWCNRDIWSFDNWFQQVVPEMLEELAKTHVGYPMIDFDKTRQTGNENIVIGESLQEKSLILTKNIKPQKRFSVRRGKII